MTVHTSAHSKMPQYNIVNNVKLFSHELVSGHQYVHRQQTIDTTVPLPHGVDHFTRINYCHARNGPSLPGLSGPLTQFNSYTKTNSHPNSTTLTLTIAQTMN